MFFLKVSEYRATLKLFSTGSITLTAPSVDAARQAIQSIYSILERFKFDQKPTITQIKLEKETTTKNTLKQPESSQDDPANSNRLENLEINNTTTTTSNNSHFNSHNSNNHHNHNHHNHHHHHHPPPTLVHYDPWSTHHLNHHNHNNSHLNHHYNHNHNHGLPLNGGVSGVGASTIDMNDTGGHLNHLNHLHHHHLHHLPPPPQPPQPVSSAHHWFGDNLLIDNVLDDFLQ